MLSIGRLNLLKSLAIKNKDEKSLALKEALQKKEQHTKMLLDLQQRINLLRPHYVSGQIFKQMDFELLQYNQTRLENTMRDLGTYTSEINDTYNQKQAELREALIKVKTWEVLIEKDAALHRRAEQRKDQATTDEFNTIRHGKKQ